MKIKQLLICASLLLACGLCSCTSPYMKGTPFYTAEGETMKDAERVPLWPILYYEKDKILSMLWPFMELSDDHFALRPVVSVHGLEDSDKIYNVLWPLARFNQKSNDHYVFPAFWGENYFSVFPLYWHRKWSKGFSDTLFPLWSHRKDTRGWRTHVAWPFMQFKNRYGEQGFHVWPLAGHYTQKNDDSYGFMAWPLAHKWSENRGADGGNTIFPLYYYEKDSDRTLLLTIPYSQGKSLDGKEKWNLLIPFFYREKGKHGTTFLSLPWSAGSKSDGSAWKCVPPLFHHSSDPKSTQLLTPLYSRGSTRDGEKSWSMLIPFFHTEKSPEGRTVSTLLGGTRRDRDKAGWMALPLLSGGSSEPGKYSNWFVGPLAHASANEKIGEKTHYVLPLYVSTSNKTGSVFASLPWSGGRNADGSSWQVTPGLYGYFKDRDGHTLVTPIYSGGKSDNGKTRWHVIAPLYYTRKSGDNEKMLATLLGGYQTDEQGKHWLVYPLLSWGKRTEQGGEFWAGAPLCHASWDQQGASHHLLPLYYWNGRNHTLVSPLAARWTHPDDRTTTMVPPLLSWHTGGKENSDLWLGGPLVHWTWGKKAGPRHILPLMYANPRNGAFASPLFAKWSKGARKTTLIPPALSWLTTRPKQKDLWLGGPLAHFQWGDKPGESHIIPLYYSNRKDKSFVSIPYAAWRNGNTTTHAIPPALSWFERSEKRKDLWLLGPLAHASWGQEPGPRHVFPLFYDNPKTKEFLSLPYATWKDGSWQHRVCPPLLSWYSTDGKHKEVNALLGVINEKWGENRDRSGHFIPLYLYDGSDEFYSLLMGWNRNKNHGFVYPLTPLVGFHTGEHSGGWLFPLLAHKRDKGTDNYRGTFLWGPYWRQGKEGGSDLFPLYHYRNHGAIKETTPTPGKHTQLGKSLWIFPTYWYKNKQVTRPDYAAYRKGDKTKLATTRTKTNTLFPLWSYSRRKQCEQNRLNVDGSLLWPLYDYEREIKPVNAKSDQTTDYTRTRVLWKLWDYEKKDGEVRVDMFPGITYDREKDGSKEITFLLRFFRYKRDPEGRKLDLLFIPIMR